MAFTALQSEQIASMMDAYLEVNRPPRRIRSELDLGWRIEGQTVYVFEIRPRWDDPSIIKQHDFAKATWVDSSKQWRLYWLRGNKKWYRYDPLPAVGNLQRFLDELKKDPHGCFKG